VSRLSIVIPCLGGAAEFDATLVSVLQNRPASSEVLVVHTEPYDDPYSLAGEVRFIESEASSLVELLNKAIEEASGDLLHIVSCGLEATEGWTARAVAHFNDPDVAAVSPIVLGPDRQTLIAAGVRWSLGGARRLVKDRRVISPGSGRLRATIHGPTLGAAFYRRDVLAALGGFDAACGAGHADIAIALAIQSLAGLHVCEPQSQLVQTSEQAVVRDNGFQTGRAAERLFWRYAAKRGLLTSLAIHPWTIAADLVARPNSLSAVASLLGRAVATLELGAVQLHQDQVAAAEQRLAELDRLRTPVRVGPVFSLPQSAQCRKAA